VLRMSSAVCSATTPDALEHQKNGTSQTGMSRIATRRTSTAILRSSDSAEGSAGFAVIGACAEVAAERAGPP